MKETTRFKRWANKERKGRGLVCHFYEAGGKQKQYYTKVDYAYFNLFNESPSWIIKANPQFTVNLLITISGLSYRVVRSDISKKGINVLNNLNIN